MQHQFGQLALSNVKKGTEKKNAVNRQPVGLHSEFVTVGKSLSATRRDLQSKYCQEKLN